VLEAFQFARAKWRARTRAKGLLATEHALLDDAGDKQGSQTQSATGAAGRVAAALSLGSVGDATLPDDPALRALYLERRELERQIESLRLLKDSMPPARYTASWSGSPPMALKTREICREDAAGGAHPDDRERIRYPLVSDVVDLDSPDDIALADRMNAGRQQIVTELKKIIVGQDEVVNQVLMTLFVGGNSLIVGAPGLAKTLLIHTMARVLDLKFSRIQFTPDLMPSDITGTDLVQEDAATGRRQMVFAPGPIFANIVLADEINRTPPKTQSALLEAMQEHRVTIQGRTYPLAEPFYVFATQNPIELEGTYPLPEAQLDRFMFHIIIDHPPYDEELDVVKTTTAICRTRSSSGRSRATT
jgi:hypothetical protein